MPAAAVSSLATRTITRFSDAREAHFEAGNVAIRQGQMAVRTLAAADSVPAVCDEARTYMRERGIACGQGSSDNGDGTWTLTLFGTI